MIALLAISAFAGGGPPNVMVLYNADVPEATDVAYYYGDARSLPPGHLCGLAGIDPTLREIPLADYQTQIQGPFDDCLSALPQPGEIDYIVVVRGLPYLVDVPNYRASLSAALAIGHATTPSGEEILTTGQAAGNPVSASVPNPEYIDGGCSDLLISNPYASWYTGACGLATLDAMPVSFRRENASNYAGYDFTENLFIVTRLDGFDYADANDLITRATQSDGTFPDTEILCMRSGDEARGARDPECEYAVRMLAADGWNATWDDTFDANLSGRSLSALFTGTTNIQGGLDGNTWSPGAISCNLTSYGAAPQNFFCNDDGTVCPESESQTSVARFVRAGATGAHGTAAEPLNNVFPNAGVLMLYTSGYNLGESYFFSHRFLFWQNIVLGDPLATPYGERPVVVVPTEVGDKLEITATHPEGVADIALYIDGVRVAESDTDVLSYAVEGDPGDTIDVLAVARTALFTVPRAGWPVSEQRIRSRVQGWTAERVTLQADDPGKGDTGLPGGADSEDGGGCGCQTSGFGGGFLLPLLLLALRRRS